MIAKEGSSRRGALLTVWTLPAVFAARALLVSRSYPAESLERLGNLMDGIMPRVHHLPLRSLPATKDQLLRAP